MKLYLSSYRLGQYANNLGEMVSGNKRIGVIRNALDFSDDQTRLESGREQEFRELEALGLYPEEIDLRQYFGATNELQNAISHINALWVVGGNTFIFKAGYVSKWP